MILTRVAPMIALRGFALIAFSLTLTVSMVKAQVPGASLSGIVSDASGAVVPQAEITVKNVATGISTAATANSDGFYSVPDLLPGTYLVTVSAHGFATQRLPQLTLSVGARQVWNFTLAVGSVAENVDVSSAAPAVELGSSSITAVVDSNTIRQLPLNGRDWTQLATLQAGVVSLAASQVQVTPQNTQRLNRGFESQLSIAGSRPQQNDYSIDGISVNDYSNSGPGSVLGIALGVDAIAEFSVETANYSAEYGRTSGGVINAITRSGTNAFHGSGYEFLRNSALDAANYFDNFTNTPKPPFKQNQFGVSAGGPILKDRTFVFGDFEGIRSNLGITSVNTVPSQDARNGILHNADGTTTIVTVDPQVQPYLAFWPVPNGPLLGTGNTGIYSIAQSQIASENFGTARGDHKISGKDSISASWQYDTANLQLPDPLGDVKLTNATSRDLGTIQETHVFTSQLLNSLRVGYSRAVASNLNSIAINPLAADHSLESIPGQYAAQIRVTGLTSISGGLHGTSISDYDWNSFQAHDDASLTKGTHTLRFGVTAERIQDNRLQVSQPAGRFSFSSLSNLLTNNPKSFDAHIPGSPTNGMGIRQSIFGAYFQDDLRWRPNFTVNLGVRYEMSTVPSEVHGYLAVLRNPTDATPHLGDPLFYNPTLRNFEPRVGFAWDPFRNGKTAIRGGFGMFDVLPLPYEFYLQEQSAAPFSEIGSASQLPQGSFPTGAAADVGGLLEQMYIDPHPGRNYVMTWNFNLQQALTPSLTGMLAYVGSRGVHQPLRVGDSNIVLPTLTPQGYLWPFPAGSGNVLNPNWGDLDYLAWKSSSSFQSLEAQVTKRMSRGLSVQGSYTWSKTIDEGSSSLAGDNFVNSISSPFFFDPKLRRGLADFDIGQNLVMNFTWLLPSPQSVGGLAGSVVKGWQLGGILVAQSGMPFTPLIGGDPLGLNSSDPFAYPTRLTGPGCQSLVNPGDVIDYIKLNCFGLPMASPAIAARCTPFAAAPGTCSNLLGNSGRNDLIGPGLVNFDFSLFKNNYIPRISESFNIQFRAEFFNVFNHANFASPTDNNAIFDQTGAPVGGAGLIDRTTTTAREIQFGLKVIW